MILTEELFVGGLRFPSTRTFTRIEGATEKSLRTELFSVDAEIVERACEAAWAAGPSSVVVSGQGEVELPQVIEHMEGQLTGSLHLVDGNTVLAHTLLKMSEAKVGRLIANGWPTGVEVSNAMVHGEPFPTTLDGRTSSAGTLVIGQCLRPLRYQDFPGSLLPAALRGVALPTLSHRYDREHRRASQL